MESTKNQGETVIMTSQRNAACRRLANATSGHDKTMKNACLD